MTLRLVYGNVPASARFDSSGRFLAVDLDRDPGIGAMSFYRISPTTVHVTGGDVDDIRRVARAYRLALDYLSPGSGRDRHAAEAERLERLAESLTEHCESWHGMPDGSYRVTCTCGAGNVAFTRVDAESWSCHARTR